MPRSKETNNSVTAKDIGDALGLSQPTVSRILTGASGYRVADATRARVIEAAQQMGYRPNVIARSLRLRRTNIVGFYTGYGYLDARNVFLATVIGSLQQAASELRMDILLHGAFRGASTDDIYSELVDGRVDGLFLHTHADDPLVERLAKNKTLPVVAIADAVPDIPSVICDDDAGTRALIAHLWEKGHRHIGYIYPRMRLASVEKRLQAFISEMQIRQAEKNAPTFAIDVQDTTPALTAIRAMPIPPTAILCWNDLTAYDLIRNCAETGLRVPGTLAVVGFDGIFEPSLTTRRLVTVGANWENIGQLAMTILANQIKARFATQGEEQEPTPPVTMLPVQLIEGDTT